MTTSLQTFIELFDGRRSAYGRYYEADGTKRVRTLDEPLLDETYAAHLAGIQPYLGVIPIREDNTCLFGAIDIDDDGIDHAELETRVNKLELPLVVCRSKSGGAHLYLFLSAPAPASVVVEALKRFRAALHYEKNANGSPVEIFPKQTKLSAGQTGNWINLPYFGGDATNRYAIRDGVKLTLDEFVAYASSKRVTTGSLQEWTDPGLGPFAEGPPCLQALHAQGFQSGGRNTGLLNVGVFFKLAEKTTWAESLEQYNTDSVAEPLDSRELVQITRNLTRHEYAYTCDQHPLKDVCNKKVCKKQPYGIGYFIKQHRLADLPELSDLVKVDTQPPSYRVKVNGVEIPLSLEEFENPARFRSVCLARLNLVFPLPKPNEWLDVQKALLANRREEHAPNDAGAAGILELYLHDFLMQRGRSESIEDVLRSGYPAEGTDGRVYFKSLDFIAFMKRRGFNQFEPHEVYTILTQQAGLLHTEKVLLGRTLTLWSVPTPENEQTEPFKVPNTSGAGY